MSKRRGERWSPLYLSHSDWQERTTQWVKLHRLVAKGKIPLTKFSFVCVNDRHRSNSPTQTNLLFRIFLSLAPSWWAAFSSLVSLFSCLSAAACAKSYRQSSLHTHSIVFQCEARDTRENKINLHTNIYHVLMLPMLQCILLSFATVSIVNSDTLPLHIFLNGPVNWVNWVNRVYKTLY